MEGFAIVEQMGHRRVTGAVAEVEVCGQRMLRVSTLSEPPIVTHVHPQSIYAITACTEAHARRAAGQDYSPLRELEAPAPIEFPADDPAPAAGSCAHCPTACGSEDWCFGCRAFVCDGCGGCVLLTGSHRPGDHLRHREECDAP